MKVDGVRICPACGARNKAAWEFCARCSEPLGDTPLGSETEVAPAPSETTEMVDDESSGSWGLPLLALVAAVLAGWAAVASRGPRQTVATTGLTFATLPPAPVTNAPARQASGRAQFEQGKNLLARGQAAEATVLLNAAVEADPQNPEYREVLGLALIGSGFLDRGVAEMETAARLEPTSAEYPRALARELSRAGRTDAAIEAYRQAAAIPPVSVETNRELADLYMRANRVPEAAAALRAAARYRPDDLVVQQDLGHALQRLGDADGAAQVYESILAAAPQAAITRGLLAEVRIAQGRFEDAISLFQDGVARDARIPLLHRGLASALERAGRDTEAAAEYREYARLAPGANDAQELAARAAALERRAAPTS